jgi:hypothetical protein
MKKRESFAVFPDGSNCTVFLKMIYPVLETTTRYVPVYGVVRTALVGSNGRNGYSIMPARGNNHSIADVQFFDNYNKNPPRQHVSPLRTFLLIAQTTGLPKS